MKKVLADPHQTCSI